MCWGKKKQRAEKQEKGPCKVFGKHGCSLPRSSRGFICSVSLHSSTGSCLCPAHGDTTQEQGKGIPRVTHHSEDVLPARGEDALAKAHSSFQAGIHRETEISAEGGRENQPKPLSVGATASPRPFSTRLLHFPGLSRQEHPGIGRGGL